MTDKLTFEQIRDVRDQLRQPLSGRPVLVPLGTKAFVPGRLQPVKETNDEEMVDLVVSTKNDSDKAHSIRMSRTQALERLQEEMDQVSNRKKAAPPISKPTQTTSTTNQSTNVLPYFEIREEIDATGTEVKAEAVNVSRHLEYLRQHPDVIQEETLPPAVTASVFTEAAQPVVEEIPVENLKPLSDGEYDALAARLEELARLEETQTESPVPKVMKKSNRKTSTSSGWSKGFLNNSTKKKNPLAEKKVVSKGVDDNPSKPVDGPLKNNKVSPTAIPSNPISKTVFSGVIQEHGARNTFKNDETKVPVNTSTPHVRFGDAQNNEIREIPRIGETSVATLARNPSRPILGAGNMRNESSQSAQQQPQVPQKKLSRFAMERQQLNR